MKELKRDRTFYRRRCLTLGSIRGCAVGSHGTLTDVGLAGDGRVETFVVETASGVRHVAVTPDLRVERPGRVSAA